MWVLGKEEITGEEGRVAGAETTGDKHSSSRSGVSIIPIGSENVVSSVRMASGELDMPGTALPRRPATRTAAELGMGTGTGTGTAVVVISMLVIGRDPRRWRRPLAADAEEGGAVMGESGA
jgi:hypothetical protein